MFTGNETSMNWSYVTYYPVDEPLYPSRHNKYNPPYGSMMVDSDIIEPTGEAGHGIQLLSVIYIYSSSARQRWHTQIMGNHCELKLINNIHLEVS